MPHPSEGLDTRRRRLLFRAWHRGMREMDLLMGRFCNAELGKLSEPEVDDLEFLMEEADRDVLSWLTGEAPTPPAFDTPVLQRLRDFHKHDAPVNL